MSGKEKKPSIMNAWKSIRELFGKWSFLYNKKRRC